MLHKFICDDCKIIVEDSNTKSVHKCPNCGKDMYWDIKLRQTGDYNFVSQSLAINPSQIPEHKKNFPNVDVLPDGRIRFNSYKQHDTYLKKTGFVKLPQKIKPKGVKI